MFDYLSSGIWDGNGVMRALTEVDLPTSVVEQLMECNADYDRTPFDCDDPHAEATEAEFCRRAHQIALKIKEAHPDWIVEFYNSDGSATPPVDLPVSRSYRSRV